MNKTITTMFLSLAVISGLFAGANIVSAQSVGGTCTTQTLRGTVSPNGHATSAWFNWSSSQSAVTNKTGYNTTVQNFSGNTSNGTLFTQDLTNLTPNTTYYYRAMASWGTADTTNAGPVLSFTTPACSVTPTGSIPTVSTSGETGVTTSGATLNGSVNGNNLTTTAWFEWGTTYSLGSETAHTSYGSGSSSYSAYLSNLSPNTTYYFRAMAQNSQGMATPGATLNFTTGSTYVPPTGSIPTVSTSGATGVTTSGATLNGSVNGNGSYTTTWFEWGTNTNYGNTIYSNSSTSGYTNFSGYISGLNQNTVYYYRAVAQSSYGTVYGNSMSFTTSYNNNNPCGSYCNYGTQPTITTTSAGNVTTSSGTMNGYVNGNGVYTTAWFEWGSTTNYGNTTYSNSYGTGYSSFNASISGLNPGTTYYYRAVAQNSYGTVYGNQFSFTTSVGYSGWNPGTNTSAPSVATTLATQMTDTSAQLNSLVFTSNTMSSNAWFEWGTNNSLGYKTNTVNVGNLPSVRHPDTITGLTRGVTYYYRIVAENSYGRANGQIMSFVAGNTGGVDNTVVINRPVTTSATTVVNYGTGIESLVKLSVNGGADVITTNERRTYDITWKNDSKLTLNKVALRIVLPEQLTFVSGSRGSFSSSDNTLTVDIRTLNPGETGNVVIVVDTKNTLKNGELIVVVANLAYTTPAGVQGIADAYATHTAIASANNQVGNIFGAGSFLPTTIFGWLLLIILTLLLVLIGNHLYGRFSSAPKH